MRLFLAVLGALILAAVFIERWAWRRSRAAAARRRESLRQVRPWWQHPPGDGPEGDH
jgi:hypothetical protein